MGYLYGDGIVLYRGDSKQEHQSVMRYYNAPKKSLEQLKLTVDSISKGYDMNQGCESGEHAF
jgi:hypothetical protein